MPALSATLLIQTAQKGLTDDGCTFAQLHKRDKPGSFVKTWKFTCVVLSQQTCRFQIRRDLNPQTSIPDSQIPPPVAALSDQEAARQKNQKGLPEPRPNDTAVFIGAVSFQKRFPTP